LRHHQQPLHAIRRVLILECELYATSTIISTIDA
jgi:hypothetical protein